MDYTRLKGRPPYPFETIAIAIAFSPRLESLLGEARRLAGLFQARLLLIHAGGITPDKQALLKDKCKKTGISAETQIVWREGDPVSVLLEVCKENLVDLLLLGALQRESMLRYYLGSVARGLSRKAKCSLLLITEPKPEGSAFGNIIVGCPAHPKTLPTLRTALYFSHHTGCSAIQAVKEVDQAGLAMALSGDSTTGERNTVREQLFHEAEKTIRENISHCSTNGIQVDSHILFGRPGFSIRNYAKDANADLLVINSPDSSYGLMDRIFAHDMEHILEDLPCNILIVHSRPSTIA